MWTGSTSQILKPPDSPTWNSSISIPMYLVAGDTVRLGVFHNYSQGGIRDMAYAAFSVVQVG
jgi:hypothetical protein